MDADSRRIHNTENVIWRWDSTMPAATGDVRFRDGVLVTNLVEYPVGDSGLSTNVYYYAMWALDSQGEVSHSTSILQYLYTNL